MVEGDEERGEGGSERGRAEGTKTRVRDIRDSRVNVEKVCEDEDWV